MARPVACVNAACARPGSRDPPGGSRVSIHATPSTKHPGGVEWKASTKPPNLVGEMDGDYL